MMVVGAVPMDEVVKGENIYERAMRLLTCWGLAEDKEQANEAEEQQHGSLFVVLKSTNDKVHIERVQITVRAFGVVFTKEMLLEQDFKG